MRPGTGSALVAKIIINDIENVRDFTYDAPVVCFTGVANIAVGAQYGSITVSGINFGGVDRTPSVEFRSGDFNRLGTRKHYLNWRQDPQERYGDYPCKTSSWTTFSSIVCHTQNAHGVDISTMVDVHTTVGTLFLFFTYDAPVVAFTVSYVRHLTR